MRRFQTFASAFLLIVACACSRPPGELTAADRAAVKETMDRYVAAWLAGDHDGVMRQLTTDSVLVPAEKTPYRGAAAIRNYWWPAGGPAFVLNRFETTVDQLTGSGDAAMVRGAQVIEWTMSGERWRTRGTTSPSCAGRPKDGVSRCRWRATARTNVSCNAA